MTTSSLKNRRRQGIDRTRGKLDDTLEELTYKIDVPARVRDKVHNVRVKTEEVKQQEQPKTEELTQHEQPKTEEPTQHEQPKTEEPTQHEQPKTEEPTQQVHASTDAFQAKAGGVAQGASPLTRHALAKLPSPVAGRIEPLMAPARQQPLITAAIALGALLVWLLLRRLLRGTV